MVSRALVRLGEDQRGVPIRYGDMVLTSQLDPPNQFISF